MDKDIQNLIDASPFDMKQVSPEKWVWIDKEGNEHTATITKLPVWKSVLLGWLNRLQDWIIRL